MKIFKASLLIFAFRTIGAALLFATYSIVSSKGGVDELARFALMLSTFTIVGTATKFGLDQLALREVQRVVGEQKSVVAFCTLALSSCMVVACTVSVHFLWKDLALTLGVFAFSLYSIIPEIYRANGSALYYSILRNLGFNAVLAVLVFSVYHGMKSINLQYMPVFAAYLSLFFSVPFFLLVYNARAIKSISVKSGVRLAKEALPIALFQYMIILHSYGYNLVLKSIGNSRDVAVFAVYLQMILVFGMFSTSVGMHVGRDISQAVSQFDLKKAHHIYINSCKVSFAVLFPAFLLLLLFCEWMLVNLFHMPVGDGIYAFYIMAVAAFLSAVTGPKFTIITMLKKEKIILYAASGLTIILTFFLCFHNLFVNKVLLVSLLYAFFTIGLSFSMSVYAIYLTKQKN